MKPFGYYMRGFVFALLLILIGWWIIEWYLYVHTLLDTKVVDLTFGQVCRVVGTPLAIWIGWRTGAKK